jgi:hypothetical protein
MTSLSKPPLTQDNIERIRGVLSNFVGPASSDVTDGIADMDIGDQDNDRETQRTKGLKYMSQLVRVNCISLCPVHLSSSAATYREP